MYESMRRLAIWHITTPSPDLHDFVMTANSQKVVRTLAIAFGLGLLAFLVLNPLLGVMAFAGTLFGRLALLALHRSGRWSASVAGLAIGQALMPISVFFFLNYLRPDLMQPMLDHVFGYLLVALIGGLAFGGGGAFLAATAFTLSTRGVVALSIARALLCTLPAILLVVFGPIVFAFMFGNIEGK
jgi:hypothetical protein